MIAKESKPPTKFVFWFKDFLNFIKDAEKGANAMNLDRIREDKKKLKEKAEEL